MNYESATRLAVISPVAAGCAWAGLMFTYYRAESGQPETELAAVIGIWMIGLLGVVGLGVLLIPLGIGLTTTSNTTRLAAAWVGALIAGLAGIFCLVGVLGADLGGVQAVVGYSAATALFVPLLVTGWAGRRPD